MLAFGLFAAITLGSLALLWVATEVAKPARRRIRRRLAGEFSEPTERSAAVPLYSPDVSSWDIDLDAAPAKVVAAKPTRKQWLSDFFREAGVTMPARQLAGIAAGGAVAVGVAVGTFTGWPVGAAAGLAAAAATPIYLRARRKARRDRYVKQLGGAFDLMARVLKAGQTVPEAFRAAADAFDDPLREEFGRCNHQIEHGLRPEAAYRELSQRSGVLELRIFVVAMTIQRQTGGNLSEVLERLAGLVRGRIKLKQRMRALTAEGRLQSITLIVLPVLTFGAMYVLNRNYAQELLTQWRLLVATAACMGVGVIWIRNVMNFEG